MSKMAKTKHVTKSARRSFRPKLTKLYAKKANIPWLTAHTDIETMRKDENDFKSSLTVQMTYQNITDKLSIIAHNIEKRIGLVDNVKLLIKLNHLIDKLKENLVLIEEVRKRTDVISGIIKKEVSALVPILVVEKAQANFVIQKLVTLEIYHMHTFNKLIGARCDRIYAIAIELIEGGNNTVDIFDEILQGVKEFKNINTQECWIIDSGRYRAICFDLTCEHNNHLLCKHSYKVIPIHYCHDFNGVNGFMCGHLR